MRKLEILDKLKEERELSKEIVTTLKLSQTGGFDARKSLTSSSSRKKLGTSSSVNFSFLLFSFD
jgi:hypothetical protein